MNLTKKQQRLLTTYKAYTEQHGINPSYRELQEILGYKSPASIWRFIKKLQQNGLLQQKQKGWRSLDLVHSIPRAEGTLPIIGEISKNTKPDLYEKPLFLPFPLGHLPPESSFYGLKVKDSSFLDEFILPEDLLLVEATQEVHPGELVLASSDRTILGHFFDEGEIIRFRASPYHRHENSSVKVAAENLQIWGVVAAIFRCNFNRFYSTSSSSGLPS